MSSIAPDPVLQRIVTAAIDATGATDGWIVRPEAEGLRVVAAAGPDPGRALGLLVPQGAGAAGYVMGSGQPIALSPGTPDPRLREGVPAVLDREPASILAVPCSSGESVEGALELVDKAGGAGFSFDDVELVTLLGTIAGAALASWDRGRPAVATPAELHTDLERLADVDPQAYADMARVIQALLGRV